MVFGLFLLQFPACAQSVPSKWKREWPRTDFSQSTIDFAEVISGGPPKDGIPYSAFKQGFPRGKVLTASNPNARRYGNIRLRWQKGMNSALDSSSIQRGRDIGFVSVQKKSANGYEDIPYDTTFAFAFKAFHPDGIIHANK